MEQTEPSGERATTDPVGIMEGQQRPRRRPLRIGDIMTRDVVTARSNDTVFSVARRMSDHGVSCVVVVDDRVITGIMTEKDILKGLAETDADFNRMRVAQRMSSPVETIAPTASIVETGRRMEERGIKRLPIADNGCLVGIVTQTDIARGLISLSPLRYVSDIMTSSVATVDADATVNEAAAAMTGRNISCLAVLHRREVTGICTEKDLLKRVVALRKDPAGTRVAEIMSFPIVAVPSSYSILSASKKMESMHLHRLVVMEGREVCGIVTQTDILRAIRSTFESLETQQKVLARQLADLVRYVRQDMERVQEFLERMQHSAVHGGLSASPTGDAGEAEAASFCIF